jgi:GNAT superfamily N-acetyltransferase/lipocalin
MICALYEQVFEMPLSLARWHWQYINNPTGKIALLLAVGEAGELAGQYALSPLILKVNNHTTLATLSLDTMVHPAYRGQGMFTKLAQDLYGKMAQMGVDLIYGFPNEQSHHGFIKNLQWIDLYQTLPLWVRPLNFSTVVKKVFRSDLLTALGAPLASLGYSVVFQTARASTTVRQVTAFDERADQLWEQAKGRAPIMVQRDQRYLNWRYPQHPDYRYTLFISERGDELLGYGVLSTQTVAGMSAAFIVDLLATSSTVEQDLIGAMLNFAHRERFDVANALMPPGHAGSLRRCGFIPLPKQLFPQELHLGVRNLTHRFSDNLLHDARNWYITWGDHDRI